MNKKDIAYHIADQEGIAVAEAQLRVDQVLDAIVHGLMEDGYVGVTGFGSLEKAERAERDARNPQTGDKVRVPATTVVRFRPGQRLKDLVAGRVELPSEGRVVAKAPKGTFTPVDAKGRAVKD